MKHFLPLILVCAIGCAPQGKVKIDKASLHRLEQSKETPMTLAYEFCIPDSKEKLKQVRAIDTSVVVMVGSKGRVGCSKSEWLCIGNLERKTYKRVLDKIAALSFVKVIKECVYE